MERPQLCSFGKKVAKKNRNISDGFMAFAKENVKSPCHWGQPSQNMLFHSHGRIIEGVSALPDMSSDIGTMKGTF